ncbi:hypothetical protein Mal52_42920 [Symmachiella dynata]|uniref:Uncharacterized protein n=1 Tax=Symmachiella dynata TaxID=2527995 RepID=A0A517ZTI3_9PLAN|nr:hypothetical protein [Symmachiella dynata]QDU45796.1 hypothetical protein Mal52_42920 [Symmachiella dynata]
MADDRRSGPVSLGCGTLIVIGLIVLIFSGGGRIQQMSDDLSNMRTDINNLRTVIEKQNQTSEDQTQAIEKQTQEIRELKNAIGQEPKLPQP